MTRVTGIALMTGICQITGMTQSNKWGGCDEWND